MLKFIRKVSTVAKSEVNRQVADFKKSFKEGYDTSRDGYSIAGIKSDLKKKFNSK